MGLVEGLLLTSLTFVLVAPSLRTMDPALEEAARMSGASARSLLWNVTLPLILPALLAAAMYVAIVAVGAFDIPAVIGLGSRIYTFSTFMYVHAYPADGFTDYGAIAAGGAVMIVIALAMTFAYVYVLRRARSFAVITGKAYRPRLTELGRWTPAAWALIAIYALGALIIPFVFTLIYALLPFAEPLDASVFSHMSLLNFAQIPWGLVGTGALHTAELVLGRAAGGGRIELRDFVDRRAYDDARPVRARWDRLHAARGSEHLVRHRRDTRRAVFAAEGRTDLRYGHADRARLHDRLDQFRHAYRQQQFDPDSR